MILSKNIKIQGVFFIIKFSNISNFLQILLFGLEQENFLQKEFLYYQKNFENSNMSFYLKRFIK
jgi:hypothetical protein